MDFSKNTQGFTLIEILIATVIITVAFLGTVILTIGIINGNSFSRLLTTATTLAQDRLEEAKRLGYSNAGAAIGTEAYGSIVDFPGYKRVTDVAYVKNDPTTKMKTITVTTYYWLSYKCQDNSEECKVDISTIISE